MDGDDSVQFSSGSAVGLPLKPPVVLKSRDQVLLEITHRLRDSLELDDVLNQLLDAHRGIVSYDAAGIFVLNQDVDVTIPGSNRSPTVIAGIANRGFDPRPAHRDQMLSQGAGIVGHVISSGQAVIVPDVRLDPRYVAGRQATRSEITIPILLNEHVIGALNLESDQLAAFDRQDPELLLFFADAAAVSIDKAILHKKLIAKEKMDRQLRLAHEVQMQLIPQHPPLIDGYEIAGVCLPTFVIGGDYYDFIDLEQGKLGMVLADVSGHGIPAALVMSAFRAMLRTQARRQNDPATAARFINQSMPEFAGVSDFVTAIYGVLDPSSGQFSYVNCGHPPLLVFSPNGMLREMSNRGPALGVFERQEYDTAKLSIESGDLLLLHTDGATESIDEEGNFFGLERLTSVVRKNFTLPLNEIISAVVQAVQSHTGNQGFVDDFTLVLLRRVALGRKSM